MTLRILSMCAVFMAPLVSLGVERYEPWLAKISSFEGMVEGHRASSHRWQPVVVDESYFKGDGVRTLDHSRARLQLPNETYWDLDQNSRSNLTDAPVTDEASGHGFLLELWEGMALFRSRQSKSVNFRTPRLNGANHGTEFLVEAKDDATIVTVYDGVVDTWNEHGKLSVAKGQSAIARKGQAPQPYLRVRPQDAVQWALYYPPVIDFQTVRAGLPAELNRAVELYLHNRSTEALTVLENVSVQDRGSLFFNLRAGILLTVGRVDEAQPDIREARRFNPKDATALSQSAVIAVAKNDKDAALDFARRAESENPKSVPAKLALSYAHQVRFDLRSAQISAQQAVDLEPDNALALNRLAELDLSLGEHDKAEAAARRALAVSPASGRAKALLGFAQLMQIDLDQAKGNFEHAVEINPSDPLSQFGLGLARIRKGDVKGGTEALEAAASLSPEDSLIRSYLGKAYYEQRRSEPAGAEFQRAKELDPKDPTPHFYDAIKKQTENRPVEALRELQMAIELNDNRAVYRSRQMLDSDLAARSAALGRVYGDLGFSPRALVEGWASVATDPTDFAGHRLLADSYSALPRHDVARTSELWLSQLLQPANLMPVQPHLAENNLLILNGAGPQLSSFNEFNPLFARNRLGVQTSALVGNNDTYADEVTQSGIWGPWSYSLGQFHYQTRGFRENNAVDQNIYNAFFQGRITPDLNIIFEARHRDIVYGDLNYTWDLSQVFFPVPVKLNSDMLRVGGHYSLSESSHLVTAFTYQNVRNVYDEFSNEGTASYLGEWQYLNHGEHVDLIVGQGLLRKDDTFRYSGTPDWITQGTSANGYVYSNIRWPQQVTWTLGLGVVGIEDDQFNAFYRRIDPKFGVRWQITHDLTLRGAVFNATRRGMMLNDQTIEPTQIAGFNQFFNDRAATRSRRLGLGLDHRVLDTLFVGVEASRRDLGTVDPFGDWAHWREQLYRGYLNWAPADWASISVEYQNEYFWSNAVNTRTQMLPISFRAFDKSGLFGKVGVTYVDQKYDNRNDAFRGQDAFVLLDMGVGYRLPKRYGIFRVEVKNLLNQKFNYWGDNFRVNQEIFGELNPLFTPDRTIFGQMTLSF